MPTREKLALLPILAAQAVLTRRRAPKLPEADGPREGTITVPGAVGSVRLLLIGDSSAAGVGVPHQDRALSGHLTRTVAEHAHHDVHWQLKARSGVTTLQALRLVQRDDPPAPADVAVVVTGVNDVIDQVTPRRAVIVRERLADWLLDAVGVMHVVFAPLPPVDDLPLLPQPLRRIAGADARAHDEAVATWASRRRDVSHVPIPDLTLTAEVLAEDLFHPGEPVYRHCGEALGRFVADRLVGGADGTAAPAARRPSRRDGRDEAGDPDRAAAVAAARAGGRGVAGDARRA